MTVFICLLRGINVGGNNMLKMDVLKALCSSLGLKDVKTYLQSGNVAFRSDEGDRAIVGRRIEEGIRKKTGLNLKVILRTTSELRKAIAANPLAAGPERNPKGVLVAFLAGELTKEAKALLMTLKAASEELHFGSGELYVYFPEGIAQSKLSNSLTEKKLGVNVTARNWNTVNALLRMAEDLES